MNINDTETMMGYIRRTDGLETVRISLTMVTDPVLDPPKQAKRMKSMQFDSANPLPLGRVDMSCCVYK